MNSQELPKCLHVYKMFTSSPADPSYENKVTPHRYVRGALKRSLLFFQCSKWTLRHISNIASAEYTGYTCANTSVSNLNKSQWQAILNRKLGYGTTQSTFKHNNNNMDAFCTQTCSTCLSQSSGILVCFLLSSFAIITRLRRRLTSLKNKYGIF